MRHDLPAFWVDSLGELWKPLVGCSIQLLGVTAHSAVVP